ncbi:transcriptional regulator [Kitasatospora viridis]|uniref:Transcriptional regulator n=1 Tax=Kitasatospora viridis TaxID=281105 RepID=A0A561UGY2_9ACTN|nr:transcriptional regulator [Kitasatospora viridis]TWF98611.1 transcriptional regulator [Kitasatospora viridis]
MTAADGLESAFHHPNRLAVVAFLSGCAEAEFRTVREECGLSEPALSKLAAAFEAAGHVAVRKGYVGKRPRTWLSLTPAGRARLAAHLAALQEIAARNAGRAADLEQ